MRRLAIPNVYLYVSCPLSLAVFKFFLFVVGFQHFDNDVSRMWCGFVCIYASHQFGMRSTSQICIFMSFVILRKWCLFFFFKYFPPFFFPPVLRLQVYLFILSHRLWGSVHFFFFHFYCSVRYFLLISVHAHWLFAITKTSLFIIFSIRELAFSLSSNNFIEI